MGLGALIQGKHEPGAVRSSLAIALRAFRESGERPSHVAEAAPPEVEDK